MKINLAFALLIAALMLGCTTVKQNKPIKIADVYLYADAVTRIDTVTYVDSSRMRFIPTATYRLSPSKTRKLAIIDVGYEGTRMDYRCIADSLAKNGYMVAAVQHDIHAYDIKQKTGDNYNQRKHFWDLEAKDIFFVAEKLKVRYPYLDLKNLVLIGHSSGADAAMFIADEYPNFAKVVIALDNRRVPFPDSDQPKILSIYSDQAADTGVLPSPEERKKYHYKIVKVNSVPSAINGAGTPIQFREINRLIINYVNKYN